MLDRRVFLRDVLGWSPEALESVRYRIGQDVVEPDSVADQASEPG